MANTATMSPEDTVKLFCSMTGAILDNEQCFKLSLVFKEYYQQGYNLGYSDGVKDKENFNGIIKKE